MKLQEAYASEKNEVGSWAEVGYKGPGSNGSESSVTSTFNYAGGNEGTWSATAKVALNDCTAGVWSVATTYDSGSVTTTATVNDMDKCEAPLTPNFCKIATSGDCTTTSTGG